jgi:hypothetical protein
MALAAGSDERIVAIGIADSGPIGTIALEECDRATGAIRRSCTAEFGRMRAPAPPQPRIELQLVVEMVREPPARLEIRLQVALQPLDRAFRIRLQLRLMVSLVRELSV